MIQIAYPWELLVVVLPFILRFLLPKLKHTQGVGLKVPFFKQLSQVFANNHANTAYLSYLKYLAILIWILMVISGAGIQWLGKPLPIEQSGRDLLIAIDLSGSMQTPDMVTNGQNKTRIDVVKDVAHQFIDNRAGDRIGLVLFGSAAYLQTPLTFDRKTVGQMLDDASIGLAGEQTAIGDAIGLSVKKLMDYPDVSRALILLTDGGNNAGTLQPLDAAKLAAKEHIKIYTIGLGAQQLTIQTAFGPRTINPSSDLDIDSLKQIAAMTGGQFFRAEDGDSLKNIYAQINQLEPVKGDSVIVRPITPFYPWSLGLALILSFILIILKARRELR
jgi:Ca-activated chloride channel family protein